MSEGLLGVCVASIVGVLLGACSKTGPEVASATPVVPSVQLGAEDVWTLGLADLASGPIVTGSIQPERRADLRAEVSAVVRQVLKENGDSVRKGELLVVLDDTAIRDSLTSAEEAARAAGQARESAERQLQRLRALQQQGMSSIQALDEADVRRNSAQSEWVAAKSRIVAARQQLERTEVRAPFDGVVSARKASAGDTVQIGKELIQVIDPASMRFEGSVAADQMEFLKRGQRVFFKVNGFSQRELVGRIRRIDAAANPVSRQVALLVDFEGHERPPIVGLYAEGRVETQSRAALMLPDAALVREGDRSSAWVLADGRLHKQAVALGGRDPRRGHWVIASGLTAGDAVVLNPGPALSEGQPYRQVAAPVPAPANPPQPGSAPVAR